MLNGISIREVNCSLQWYYNWSEGDDFYFFPSVVIYAVQLFVGWMLFIGTFLIFPIRERLTNAKQVQIMAGVHPVIFWLGNLLWDFLLFLVIW